MKEGYIFTGVYLFGGVPPSPVQVLSRGGTPCVDLGGSIPETSPGGTCWTRLGTAQEGTPLPLDRTTDGTVGTFPSPDRIRIGRVAPPTPPPSPADRLHRWRYACCGHAGGLLYVF